MYLSQRIPDEATLRRKVEANVRERNENAVPVTPFRTPGDNSLACIRTFQLADADTGGDVPL